MQPTLLTLGVISTPAPAPLASSYSNSVAVQFAGLMKRDDDNVDDNDNDDDSDDATTDQC